MNTNRIVLSGLLATLLFSGCTTKLLNDDYKSYSKQGYKDLKEGNKNSITQKIKEDEIRNKKNYIDLSISKDLSAVLKELGIKNNRVYLLCGKDITLKKSPSSKLLNITDFNDLKKYIEDTTNYTITITNNKYIKNRVKQVMLIDKKAKKVFKSSDLIIVPTTLDANSIKRAVNTIIEINTYCDDIIIVVNRVKDQTLKKYEQSIEILKGLGKKIYFLRESEIFTNSIHTGDTITTLYNKNGLSKKNYKKVYKEYKQILDYINEKAK